MAWPVLHGPPPREKALRSPRWRRRAPREPRSTTLNSPGRRRRHVASSDARELHARSAAASEAVPSIPDRRRLPYDTGVAKRMPMAAATASEKAHPNTHTPNARAVLL
jgi:hypothetical protein